MNNLYIISGIAHYLEKISLAPDSTLHAFLEDISFADAPAEIIATCIVENAETAGLDFELHMPVSAIIEGRTYAIRVRIETAGELRFINKTSHPVDPRANYLKPIEVLVASV
ncbi:YbaY family lipoprotein [Pseudomonas sp. SWRI92]|uniref:YbaY family lipoprotein n=1 Tax=Pseudomonas marvdashtae TaxID=2745500 RepID=A0A923FRT7_9PSED|nr:MULTISPECIES: YbaY family lipoprotein [Pseudomonas]MBC3373812.1 YbaY family lipoprotein [Pseudomonas sp. SWRI92]MBV4553908.1 YbaY family lipoprotein [Pseudomonas marvdashtae]